MAFKPSVGGSMQVGDLVTTIQIYGTRLGLVEETWDVFTHCERTKVKVLWFDGETGTYFSGQLEVVCKSET